MFRESGTRPLLAGGYAVNAYGYSRFTYDIDFVAGGDEMAAISEHLLQAGFCKVLQNDFMVRFTVDLADIVMMLKRNGVDAGDESFRTLCLKFGSADLYERILCYVRG